MFVSTSVITGESVKILWGRVGEAEHDIRSSRGGKLCESSPQEPSEESRGQRSTATGAFVLHIIIVILVRI